MEQTVHLSSVATIQMGYQVRFKQKITKNIHTHIVLPVHFNKYKELDWRAVSNDSRNENNEQPENIDSFYLKEQDILFFSKCGSYYASCISFKNKLNKIPTVAASHFYVIRADANRVLPEFLAWQLNQQPCRAFLKKNEEGTLTRSVRSSALHRIPIALPKLSKQAAIVELHQVSMRQIKNYHRLIKNNEQAMTGLAQSLHMKQIMV